MESKFITLSSFDDNFLPTRIPVKAFIAHYVALVSGLPTPSLFSILNKYGETTDCTVRFSEVPDLQGFVVIDTYMRRKTFADAVLYVTPSSLAKILALAENRV